MISQISKNKIKVTSKDMKGVKVITKNPLIISLGLGMDFEACPFLDIELVDPTNPAVVKETTSYRVTKITINRTHQVLTLNG
jgi:hypothetical protein